MTAEKANIQMKWTEKLGEPLQKDRYAFNAVLSQKPTEPWVKCFREIVELFNRTGPFEASIHGSHAVVFGPLNAFETKLSIELREAVSQTNEVYNRQMEQEAFQQKRAAGQWAEEEKIREDLRKKFVKE